MSAEPGETVRTPKPTHQPSTLSSLFMHVKKLSEHVKDYRVIHTAVLCLAWFCMVACGHAPRSGNGRVFQQGVTPEEGLYVRIVGPTLIDLKDRLGVDYEEISRVLVSHTVGYFLSTIASGIFLDFLPKYAYMVLASAFFMAGVGTAGTPFTTTLTGLGFFQHLAGWGHGFTDSAGSVVCMRLWGEKASAPMHAMHAGYPIGAFIIPLIAIRFLSPDRPAGANGTTPPPLTVEEARQLSKVQWPYVGVSVAEFTMCILFFYFQYREMVTYDSREKKKAPKSFSAFLSPGRFLGGQGLKATFLLVVLFLFFSIYQFNQNPFTNYMVSYMVESNMYSKPDAGVVYSTYWICYASMRWLSIVIAAWVPIHIMMSVELTVVCISGIVLAVWGATNKTVFWVFTCILGFAISPVFPGGTAWANYYLDASSIVFAICVVGASVGSTVAVYITGYLFEYVGPRSMLYFVMGCGCALLAAYVVMQTSVSPLVTRKFAQELEMEVRDGKDLDSECEGVDVKTPCLQRERDLTTENHRY